uniref:Uncharacterized protein n=1 Tax=Anabas testudineus TaxID=64144 RepID=A0A3Q1I374_ANATE
MFNNKSAWFSTSVPQTCQDFWILQSGTIASWRTADYLFSADATCPDTLRIFESKDFLWNEVMVFHSLFLSICEKRQSVKSVCIGHYVLPPASCETILYIFCVNFTPFPLVTPGYVSMDSLQKYSRDLCDFHPVCFRCTSCKTCTYMQTCTEHVNQEQVTDES